MSCDDYCNHSKVIRGNAVLNTCNNNDSGQWFLTGSPGLVWQKIQEPLTQDTHTRRGQTLYLFPVIISVVFSTALPPDLNVSVKLEQVVISLEWVVNASKEWNPLTSSNAPNGKLLYNKNTVMCINTTWWCHFHLLVFSPWLFSLRKACTWTYNEHRILIYII